MSRMESGRDMPTAIAPLLAAASGPGSGTAAIDVVAQLGREVAGPLSSALERVVALATTGRIDRQGLRALRDEIERARRAGIIGQQLARLGAGDVAIGHEALDLPALLRQALRQREPEIAGRGLEVRQRLAPARVGSDPTLVYTLLQALLDWAFEHAAGRIELEIEHRAWPAHALLVCRYAHTPVDTVDSCAVPLDGQAGTGPDLDTLSWRLLQQAAALLGVSSTRDDDLRETTLTLGFPEAGRLDAALAAPLAAPAAAATAAHPLAGQQVLVLAARRELCSSVREALRPLGVLLDFVSTVAEAREYCDGGLPHAIVHDAGLGGEGFAVLRAELRARHPQPVFIELAEQGRALEVHNVAGHQTCRVGRDAIFGSLPAALLFELTQPAGRDQRPNT